MSWRAEDKDLAALAREGNRDAYALLVRRYHRVVHGLALTEFMSLATAEQVCGDLFEDAFAHLHTLKRPENFKSWLFGRYERVAKAVHSGKSSRPEKNEAKPSDWLTAPAAGTDLAEQTSMDHAFLADLQELSEENRRVLILHFAEGLDYESIADALDQPLSAVRSRMSRAKMELLRQSGSAVDT